MPRSIEEAADAASRALQREQMSEFGTQLEWLMDPGKIPEAAIQSREGMQANTLGEQCTLLAYWMAQDVAKWSQGNERNLSYADTFDNYGVPVHLRPYVRDRLRGGAMRAYAPGIVAMAEMVAVVPIIANREGVDDKNWSATALESRKFGRKISLDGTSTQFIVREYLRGSNEPGEDHYVRSLNPAKLKLDTETGITTVTPLEDIIKVTQEEFDRLGREIFVNNTSSGVCVALQAKAPRVTGQQGCPRKDTMFDAMWGAYVQAADRLIYPNFSASQDKLPSLTHSGPDLRRIIRTHVNAYYYERQLEML